MIPAVKSPNHEITMEFDTPWKLMLDWQFKEVMELFFPKIAAMIDWTVTPEPMDTELAQLAPEHIEGKKTVDKLFKVVFMSREIRLVYIHIEVQAQKDGSFERRMWVYNYRLFDKFGEDVFSLAILADDDPGWRPCMYRHELAGCIRFLEFPSYKLSDLGNAEEVFEKTGNKFALFAAAHLLALRTRHDPEARIRERLRLVIYLQQHGMSRHEVRKMFRLMAWLTRVPADLELKFREALVEYGKKENIMTLDTLLSPMELAMIEEGRQEGRQEGCVEGALRTARSDIVEALELRFGVTPNILRERLDAVTDQQELKVLFRRAITTQSLETFLRQFLL